MRTKQQLEQHAQELHVELEEANERLLRIWELHQSTDDDYCEHCLYTFPCPTVQSFFLCDCCGHNGEN